MNVLRTGPGDLAVIDWEHAAVRLAGHDQALLWVLLAGDPGRQAAVVNRITDRPSAAAFWLNAALLLVREIRIQQEAARAHPSIAARVPALTVLTGEVRARTRAFI